MPFTKSFKNVARKRRNILKAIGSAWLVSGAAVTLGTKSARAAQSQAGSCPKPKKESTPVVRLQTNFGAITLELYSDKAPITVANFLTYVKSGYYDNTLFHRVIDGFMIQGGGFEAGMQQKEANAPIQNEAGNGLTNDPYTIAMARTPNPHSASSQFFINVNKNDALNFRAPTPQGFGYCVFGKVIEGTEVVDKIKKVATGNRAGHQDVPTDDVTIEKAEVC